MELDRLNEKIVKRLSDKYDMPPEKIRKMIRFTYGKIRECLEDERMPRILIKGFLTFYVRPEKIDVALTSLISSYAKGKISEKRYQEDKEQYTRNKKRLSDEVYRRSIKRKSRKISKGQGREGGPEIQ